MRCGNWTTFFEIPVNVFIIIVVRTFCYRSLAFWCFLVSGYGACVWVYVVIVVNNHTLAIKSAKRTVRSPCHYSCVLPSHCFFFFLFFSFQISWILFKSRSVIAFYGLQQAAQKVGKNLLLRARKNGGQWTSVGVLNGFRYFQFTIKLMLHYS